MLLLIALANVTAWLPAQSFVEEGAADRAWTLVRTMLIDGRSYPLFAMLFGFGLATIAVRYYDCDDAARTLRRRGWWLMAFGLLHSLVFAGDVLGAYGLTAVILGGLIARRRRTAMIVLATLIATLSLVAFLAASVAFDPSATGKDPSALPDMLTMPLLQRLGLWAGATVSSVALSAVLPCVVIGVFIRYSGILSEPHRHRRLLGVTAVVGLALAAALGLPSGLALVDDSYSIMGDVLTVLGSYPGGLGWLALIAWLCARRTPADSSAPDDPLGPPASSEEPRRGAGGVLVAVGRRSMTAYLAQSLVFAAVFGALHAAGLRSEISDLAAAGIAVATWAVIALFCAVLARYGKAGPFESALRLLLYGRQRRSGVIVS